jgi:DNA-binding transcriptional LysR family regulator
VNRSRTPVELTAAGQLFLVTARTVVEQLGEVLRHLHHLEGGQGEVMQVAAAHSLALGFFPRWIAQLRNEGLNIATRLVATNVGDAVHALREGGCDLMLAFYDPDAAMQMDPEIFPSLHLGQTEMLPVCAADADGKPLFDLEGEASVPLLAYSAGAFLGRSVNGLLRQRQLRFTTIYETAMADSLKSMALEGLGIAWVPQLSVRAELARGELVVCGGPQWHVPLGDPPLPLRPGAQSQRAVALAQARRRRRAQLPDPAAAPIVGAGLLAIGGRAGSTRMP